MRGRQLRVAESLAGKLYDAMPEISEPFDAAKPVLRLYDMLREFPEGAPAPSDRYATARFQSDLYDPSRDLYAILQESRAGPATKAAAGKMFLERLAQTGSIHADDIGSLARTKNPLAGYTVSYRFRTEERRITLG